MAEPSFKDLAYRALANTLGGPVDITTMLMRPFGYNVPPEQVFGSSEYLGRQLEQGGLVSEARDPTQEFLASMMVPSPNLPIKAVGMLPEIAAGLMGLGMMRNVGSVDDLRRTADQLKQESSRLREIYQQSPTQENMQRYLDTNEQRQALIDQIAEASAVRSKPQINLSREEFLGSPKVVSNTSAKDLKPSQLTTQENLPKVPFMGGQYQSKMNEDGIVVFDGDKIIGEYNFGDKLVVDPKYRRQGIAEEMVYEWRSTYPAPAVAKTRTKASQEIQEKVWERIQSEQAPQQTSFAEGYRGMHTAPMRDSGAPLSQLDQVYPDDIYSRQAVDFYGTGSPRDAQIFNKVQKFRNKPNADVTVYRAVPKDLPEGADINRGDWVTIDKQYAKDHGESALGGDYKIIQKKVKAKDIYTNADSIYEFGYDPDVQEMSDAIRKGLLD